MIQRVDSKVDADTTIYLFSHGSTGVEGILRIDIDGYIMSLFVQEEARGKGIGTELMQTAFAVLREIGKSTVGLSVHHDNHRARALYERLGFLPYMPGHDGYTQFVKVL
ncbi:GNAT family N-acetyltransferase [Hymenobacter sp. GOD-10R]|uniref:GNAT family N-acetyltransferase n=1 Tax=Hymenobacter sp. GOD-10R TaxID=3093922 RepID=UPI002D764E32|nr:GNAT family N-acetyltransferase [Hymenobacter sp. GOD-10R]WRQ26681.1 GNAT family N-acetyltransferase [Hymenobacter sp. GOD-10R]